MEDTVKIISIKNRDKKIKNNIPRNIIIHTSKEFDEIYSEAVIESINILLNPL
ncbi:hypothetical protein [Porcipelethomonas sp.]|uniref:hypothetical protein n=1 Tax=Porcipelethomonas sp. TaxID=2981675 RepID=UPI003EF4719E